MTQPIEFARAGVLDAQGIPPEDDTAFIAVGILVEIDAVQNRVVVAVNGGAGTRMPFIDGIYDVGHTVYVMRNPFEGGRAVLCLGPTRSAPAYVVGEIGFDDSPASRAVVAIDGATYMLPYIPLTTFTVPSKVYVLREPQLGGWPTLILGPCTVPPPPAEEAVIPPPLPPPPPPPPPTEFETATATILPTYTGTFRFDEYAWDRWQFASPAARSTLFQTTNGGPLPSQGLLTGLACYGNQVTNLGATSIESIKVRLRGAGLDLDTYPPITVQGSPHGERPGGEPLSSGDTASGSTGKAGSLWLELPNSFHSDFLSGAVKGLALVGPGKNAVLGTSAGDGMALRITYTRPN